MTTPRISQQHPDLATGIDLAGTPESVLSALPSLYPSESARPVEPDALEPAPVVAAEPVVEADPVAAQTTPDSPPATPPDSPPAVTPDSAAEGGPDQLSSRGASAYRWSFISLFIRVALQAISGVIIARQIGPKAFGAGMLIVSIYSVASGFVIQGSNGTLIIRRLLPRRMIVGILAIDASFGVLAAGGFLVAAVLSHGDLRLGLLVAGAGCLVNAVSGPGYALSSRALRFNRISGGEIVGAVIGTSVAIAISTIRHSLVALPVQMVVIDAGVCLMVSRSLFHRPEPLGGDAKTDVGYRYGLHTAGNQLASVGARNADNYLVAGFLGQAPLGLYVLAYRLMMLPVQNIAMVLTRVLVPRLRHLTHDRAASENEVRKLILAIALPVGAITGAFLPFAHHVMTEVFGHRYDGAVGPTQVLLLAAFPQCAINISSCVFAAAGRGRTQLMLTSTSLAFAVLAVIIGQPWGIQGVTIVYCVLAFVLATASVRTQTRSGLVSWRPFAEGFRFYAIVAAACAGIGVGWRVGLPHTDLVGSLGELVAAMIVGSVVAALLQTRSMSTSTGFWISVAKGSA